MLPPQQLGWGDLDVSWNGGHTHTVPTLLRVSASTPREWGLGGSPGVRAGPVAVFNPSKCLREAASGISWIMLAGAEGGCGTDGADDNGGGTDRPPHPAAPRGWLSPLHTGTLPFPASCPHCRSSRIFLAAATRSKDSPFPGTPGTEDLFLTRLLLKSLHLRDSYQPQHTQRSHRSGRRSPLSFSNQETLCKAHSQRKCGKKSRERKRSRFQALGRRRAENRRWR